MRLDYGTMISPDPVRLTVGTIRKPLLSRISEIGFEQFGLLENFLTLTPKDYYTKYVKEQPEYWTSMSDDQKNSMTIFQAIAMDHTLQMFYLDLFRFFFEEPVDYSAGLFVILNSGTEIREHMNPDDILCIVNEDMFHQIISILKQVCGMKVDDLELDHIPDKLFKNAKAKALYEKMQKAKKDEAEVKERNPNFSLPNIISAIVARHPSINYTNIWQLTVYQVLDLFNRMRNGAFYDIDQTRVSVWGDEKNTFKPESWYQNEYDKKES